MPDGTDHERFADWWTEGEERAGMRGEFPDDDTASAEGNGHDAAAGDDPAPLTMLQKRTRAQMLTRRLRYVFPQARALPRGLVTSFTSFGGVGKTRAITQILTEAGEGLAPFGEETFKPDRRVRSLYIGAEDGEPLFNEIALPLLGSDDATLPFDVLLLEEQATGFVLDAARARELARFAQEHGPYDIVALDPLSALIPMEFSEAVKNQFVARQWQRVAFGPLRAACPEAAIVLAAHDTKTGAPMSGSADFINFGRCVLHLRAGGTEGVPADVPEGSIELLRFKDNVGFRWKRMILRRDPDTLLLTVTSTEAAYGAGARSSHRSQAEIEQYLATQAMRFLRPSPMPESERTKNCVAAALLSYGLRDGLTISARGVDRFLDAYCRFRADRHGRSTVHILEDVTDPSAANEARYGD